MGDFLDKNYTPYLGVIFFALTLFSIFTTTIFTKNKKSKNITNMKELVLTAIKYISLTIVFLIFCINSKLLNIINANVVFGVALFFYILHIELLVKYISRGKEEVDLYKPFMYIKLPMQITLSGGIVFLSIWSKSLLATIFSLVFAIIHIYTSYIYFKKHYIEYRELIDEERKSTGKKILKGERIPKGKYIVAVVVFMYNAKKRKWLMQKRSKVKGSKWATTSGHPKFGESSIDGMITEIEEEIGIKVEKEELTLVTTQRRKDKFVDIYYMEKDIDIESIKLQKEEVSDVKYLTDRDVEKFYEAGKFKKTHYEYFKLLKDKIK